MEPEGSLPHSQVSITRLYPGPAQSSPYTYIPPPGIHPNITHSSMPKSLQWSPSLWFPHQDPIHPPLLITEAKGVVGEELHHATTSFALNFFKSSHKEPKGARGTVMSCINKV